MNKIDETLQGKKIKNASWSRSTKKEQYSNKKQALSKIKSKKERRKQEKGTWSGIDWNERKKVLIGIGKQNQKSGGKKTEIRIQGSTLLHRNENEGHKDIAK